MWCSKFVFFFRLSVLMAIWGRLEGLRDKVKLKFLPRWMSPLITSSSFIFPNSLISCCYCYFAASLCFPRVKLISHFLLLPTSSPSPLTINCLHTTLIFCICFFWIFSLTFLFSLFIFWIFFLTLCAPLF